MRLTASDRLIDYLPWALATLLVAAIVHLVSVLTMPAMAPSDAYARLSAYARAAGVDGALFYLPAPTPDAQLLPFEDPGFVEAACIFDLSKGLLHVRAPVSGDDLVAFSFHASGGRVFHALTDRSAIKGKVDIVIGDARQIEALAAADAEGAVPQEVRIVAPTLRGFMLARSLSKRASDFERARSALSVIRCDRQEALKD